MDLERLKMERLLNQYKLLPNRLQIEFSKKIDEERLLAMKQARQNLQLELIKMDPIISKEYIKKMLGIDE